MRRKLITVSIISCITLGLLYAGCISPALNDKAVKNKEATVTNTFVEEFKEAIFDKKYTAKELVVLLDDNIMNISKQEATDAVHSLLYVLTTDMTRLTMDEKLMSNITKYKMDEGSQIEEGVRKEIEELLDIHYAIIERDNQVLLGINYPKLMSKYSDYVTDEFKDLLLFYSETYSTGYWKEAEAELDYQEIVNRINKVEQLIDKYEEQSPSYLDFMKELELFYLNLYLGGDSGQYIYEEDGLIKESALNSYKDVVANGKEGRLKGKLRLLLQKLEEVGNRRSTDLEVFLLDLRGENYETISSDGASNIEDVLGKIE